MAVSFSVVAEQLRTEATSWQGWSEDIAVPAADVMSLALRQPAFSFSTRDVMASLSQEYDVIWQSMWQMLNEAVTQFEAMADALHRAAAIYDSRDQDAGDSFGPIFNMFR
jgi:hypothetical protein